jgi:hypothetical protein
MNAMADYYLQHHAVLLLQLIGGAAFLLMMLRPFLRHISKESRRCAELLVQLPPDFDVEGMVAATWGVVKHVSSVETCNKVLGSRTSVNVMHHDECCYSTRTPCTAAYQQLLSLQTPLQACVREASLAEWLEATA